jgi:diguanylate cyclase (GGDEF)-like protein
MTVIAEGWHGDLPTALARIGALIPALERSDDPQALLLGLWGQAGLQRQAEMLVETQTTTDLLEQAALERMSLVWVAAARALRATVRLDAGDVGASMTDLARVDLDQLDGQLGGLAGNQLLDTLARAYSRLRLHDRVDDVRARIEESIVDQPPLQRAVHWAHWATELAERAMEPFAAGTGDPDPRLLVEAVDIAVRISTVPLDLVPDRLRRGADGIRALAAAYRGKPAEALRLLGEDAYRQPVDLPGMSRQLAVLAAIRAHVLNGAPDLAMALDDETAASLASTSHLVLEVCRARERLTLQTRTGGDVTSAVTRLSQVLAQLAWQGMDVMAEAARQALEHQALRVESRTDALTGVGNRRALDEELRNLLRFSPLPLSLVLVDVDDFKRVNDRFTHVIGDEVLRRVAASLSQQLRTGDRLVRYGGDEFVVLLPLTGDTEAESVATRMIQAISRLAWTDLSDGLVVRITTGCATLWTLSHRRPDGDAEHLFRLADERLLDNKRAAGVDSLLPAPARPAARRRRATGAPVEPPKAEKTPEPDPEPDPERTVDRATDAEPTPTPAPTPARSPQRPQRAPASSGALSGMNGSQDADPLGEYGRATAANLQLPFSPAAGLPLYRALLADPPRVDPYLGTLPPAGRARFTAGPALPLRPIPPAAPTQGPGPSDLRAADDLDDPDDPDDLDLPDPDPDDEPPPPADVGHNGRVVELDDADDDPLDDEPPPRPARPRRRPPVIDLSDDEDHRFPFG